MRKQVPVPKAPPWLARRCPPTCVLCGARAAFACIYLPGPASPIAPPKPLVRIVPYGLCKRCGKRRKKLFNAIEAVIERGPVTVVRAGGGKTPGEVAGDGQTVDIRVPLAFKVRGGRKEIILPPGVETEPKAQTQRPLVLALAKAYRWQRLIDSGEVTGMEDIAKQVGLDRSYVARLLQITSLAPEFVQDIIAGREPSGMSLGELRRGSPIRWDEHRRKWSSE